MQSLSFYCIFLANHKKINGFDFVVAYQAKLLVVLWRKNIQTDWK